MLRLSRLETRTQEIVLILTGMTAASLLFGSLFYIYLSPNVIYSITGSSGTRALAFLFHHLGYGTFLIPFSLWLVGDFTITHTNTWRDIAKYWRQIGWQSLLQAFVVAVSASFLTIIQTHFRFAIDEGISNGAGGAIGILFGGELYRQLGLFGSSAVLLSLSIVAGILSGLICVASVLLYVIEVAKHFGHETVRGLKATYDFILERIGVSEDKLADGLLEFESATGQYLPPHEMPKFIHHFVEKDFASELPKDKVIELPVIGASVPGKKKEKEQARVLEALQKKLAAKKGKKSDKKDKDAKDEPDADDSEANDASEDAAHAGKAEAAAESPEAGAAEEILVKPFSKRYSKPDHELLRGPAKHHEQSKSEIEKQKKDLEARLASFKLPGKIVEVHSGYRLTMYEFLPDAGVKLSKIASLSNDLALLLGADSIRVLTPIPGKTTVGIEVPQEKPTPLNFSELVKPCEKAAKERELPIALGKNVYNDVVTGDIASMPHLLISGTTGSGKSVFMNTLISSLLYTKTPKELRFLMVDPKMIELSPYNGIPHLLKPVVTDVVEAKNLLVWAEKEMDARYKMFGDTGSRNIVSFNEMVEKGSQASAERKAGKKFEWLWGHMPYIVIVIDELADLMITQGKEVEIPITRIAQKARAAGIHLVIATQRPSAEIVTGLIKTNFPTRIAFKVSSSIDSRTILDTSGAEKLLGNGDMLYMPNGKSIERLQASFVSEEEVKKIVRSISE